jgi:hypothetical protein
MRDMRDMMAFLYPFRCPKVIAKRRVLPNYPNEYLFSRDCCASIQGVAV